MRVTFDRGVSFDCYSPNHTLRPVYTTDEIGTRTHFIRAWTTYLHGPSTDKMGTGANFIRAVLQVERSVNGPLFSHKDVKYCKR